MEGPAGEVAADYIQNVAVKYSFPLDEDEILESDYIKLNKISLETASTYDYQVSMNTVHTYLLDKKDPIEKLLAAQDPSQRMPTNMMKSGTN
jgi:hypothetical protein